MKLRLNISMISLTTSGHDHRYIHLLPWCEKPPNMCLEVEEEEGGWTLQYQRIYGNIEVAHKKHMTLLLTRVPTCFPSWVKYYADLTLIQCNDSWDWIKWGGLVDINNPKLFPRFLVCIMVHLHFIEPKNMKELDIVEFLDFLLYFYKYWFNMDVSWDGFHPCMPGNNFWVTYNCKVVDALRIGQR